MSGSGGAVTQVFDRVSKVYDNEVVQTLIYRPTQDRVLIDLRALSPARILDVGCGTGQLTARIQTSLRPQLVYGCDPSSGMLAQARARSNDVVWLEGRAEAVPLPDGSVDAVISTEAFHFFDQPAAVAEFRRLLAPGGHVVLGLLNPITTIGSRILDLPGAGHWPTRREMRDLLTGAGLDVVRQTHVRRLVGRLTPTYVTVAVKPVL
jgi:ubiquinone/menaquinone biosynthesis C-methylase UbiE